MRKPSWNKSQAIQQVISLKTLLETTADFDGGDDGGARRKRFVSSPENQHRVGCKPLFMFFFFFCSFWYYFNKLAAFFVLFFLLLIIVYLLLCTYICLFIYFD